MLVSLPWAWLLLIHLHHLATKMILPTWPSRLEVRPSIWVSISWCWGIHGINYWHSKLTVVTTQPRWVIPRKNICVASVFSQNNGLFKWQPCFFAPKMFGVNHKSLSKSWGQSEIRVDSRINARTDKWKVKRRITWRVCGSSSQCVWNLNSVWEQLAVRAGLLRAMHTHASRPQKTKLIRTTETAYTEQKASSTSWVEQARQPQPGTQQIPASSPSSELLMRGACYTLLSPHH